MEFWPTGFPKPRRNFSTVASGNQSRSNIATGLKGQRQRFLGQDNFIELSWEMKASVFADFRAFHQFAIRLGNDWFTLPLPLGLASFDTYVDTVARFMEGKFAFQYVEPAHYRVTAQLELRERPMITLVELNTLLAGAVADFPQDYLMVEDDKVFTTYPEPGEADEMIEESRIIRLRD